MKRLFFILSTLGLMLTLNSGRALAQGFDSPIWQASYWNNRFLSGPPVVQRRENSIDYNWGTGSPDPEINSDNFSARWVSSLDFSAATYRFAATSDDGIRVWVDGDLIIDKWYDHPVQTFTGDKYLSAGSHQIVVEYYEHTSGAIARVWWAPAPPADGHNWRGEYYNNTSLSGSPALVRQDPAIGFNWTSVSPGPGVRAEKFSVRWTQSINFQPGNYRFEIIVDDGARLWVNGNLVIDAWQIQSPHIYTGEIYLPGGNTPVRLDYFNNLLGAIIQLYWSSVPARTNLWQHVRGTALVGPGVLARQDADINYIVKKEVNYYGKYLHLHSPQHQKSTEFSHIYVERPPSLC